MRIRCSSAAVKGAKLNYRKTGIVGVEVVRDTQELILITSNGIVIGRILKLSVSKGRNTSGSKIQKQGK